jgi:phosphoglucomutase
MLDLLKEYQTWLDNADAETQAELLSLIHDSFYRTLEFGTGGLRGVIGAGKNRINKYVVGQATQGLANQLIKSDDKTQLSVAIAYDSRNMSPEFAQEAAVVLAANHIKVYLFESLRPTPELSFAVKHLQCDAGIVITASHNPAKYNGYKVYGDDGSQITPETADIILNEINNTDIFSGVEHMDFDDAKSQGLIEIIGEDVDKAYIDCVKEQSVNPLLALEKGKDYTLIYTPLHGSGNLPVRRVLNEMGFTNVIVVPEQELPDGNFSTVKSPNPEDKATLDLAVKYAYKHNADLIIGTDPDCDRVGIAVKNNKGEYVTMTGNQVGVLLTEYIASQSYDKIKNGVIVKTIVTTDMVRAICKKYKLAVEEVLTGFKFIGEKIMEYEQCGDKNFVFGFEESYGYLKGTYARDKDAVVASMLIAEMALYYQTQGLTLYKQMQILYKTYGYYIEDLVSVTMEGSEGNEKINAIMRKMREVTPDEIGGLKVLAVRDYKLSQRKDIVSGDVREIFLPKSDVLYFELEGGNNFIARPSGTEPKIKFYLMCKGKSRKKTEETIKGLKEFLDCHVAGSSQ